MEKIPALVGLQWVRQGFVLFRKQPAEMSTLFLSYMFLMFALGAIPVLGQLLPLFLVPVFSIAFMQACANIEQGKRIYPNLLLTGFRSQAMLSLLKLGGMYLLAAVTAVAASSLIDGGVFWMVISGQKVLDENTLKQSSMALAMLFAALVYTPAAMAFWYAATLVAWQNMPVGKSVFYSFFTVHRAGRAFMVYALAWGAIGVMMPLIVSSVIALLLEKAVVTIIVLLPLSIVLTVIMYCSFYPTYTYMFGKPQAPADPAPPDP